MTRPYRRSAQYMLMTPLSEEADRSIQELLTVTRSLFRPGWSHELTWSTHFP